MKCPDRGELLRIFIGDSDMHEGRPLYEAIVLRARECHLAGATVFRGSMGFGQNSIMHSSKILELSSDLPVVIEIIDTEQRIRDFVPVVEAMVKDGLVTLEAVEVIKYSSRTNGKENE
ncbi:MAG: DUF190 domain-containing protein [Candidatus Sumerlaeaceae bacterium]|nr:DUF190 domain-containing protein [Candidatus Sumerlaeaceae bacterium]